MNLPNPGFYQFIDHPPNPTSSHNHEKAIIFSLNNLKTKSKEINLNLILNNVF